MTQHNDSVCLQHMLEYAQKAVAMVRGRTREDLTKDEILGLALTRAAEIIGEAATRVSPEGQQRHAQVPWPQIIGLRNRLAHGYDAVDMDILWDIVQQDLPPLIETLQSIIASEK
jgi:uncharacterized protein with HEPN domain